MSNIIVFVDGATPGTTELDRALLGLDRPRTKRVVENQDSQKESSELRQAMDLARETSRGARSDG